MQEAKEEEEDTNEQALALVEVDDEDTGPARKKRYVHRSCQKRTRSEREQQSNILTALLAAKGISYQEFGVRHRRSCAFRRSGVCTDGGFVQFKVRLIEGKQPERACCLDLLEQFALTQDYVQEVLAGNADIENLPADADQDDQVNKKKSAKKKKGKTEAEIQQQEAEDKQACLDLLKEYSPFIELLPGNLPIYRCNLCKSKAQPEGKVNKLVAWNVGTFHFLLKQHTAGATHIKNMARAKAEAEGSQQKRETLDIPCPGYCIESGKSPGTLHIFEEEFKLWVTHNDISQLSQHSYWWDMSKNIWCLRSSECTQELIQESEGCCAKCKLLSNPKGPQRHALRFAGKYYAALLLNKRLFCTESEVSEFVQKVASTSFGSRSDVWLKIQQMRNADLQQFVRNSFSTIPPKQQTQNLALLLSSTVAPALSVHVSAIDNKMRTLFAQFAQAVDENQLKDTCML